MKEFFLGLICIFVGSMAFAEPPAALYCGDIYRFEPIFGNGIVRLDCKNGKALLSYSFPHTVITETGSAGGYAFYIVYNEKNFSEGIEGDTYNILTNALVRQHGTERFLSPQQQIPGPITLKLGAYYHHKLTFVPEGVAGRHLYIFTMERPKN